MVEVTDSCFKNYLMPNHRDTGHILTSPGLGGGEGGGGGGGRGGG